MSHATIRTQRPTSVVDVKEFLEHPVELVRRVEQTGETIEIMEHGEIVARIAPPPEEALSEDQRAERDAADAAIWERLDHLAQEIGKDWPKGLTAAEAIRQDRGDL